MYISNQVVCLADGLLALLTYFFQAITSYSVRLRSLPF